jgi:S-adenosylmethionine-diacylgycerolhomoserine-N-methlytransferase
MLHTSELNLTATQQQAQNKERYYTLHAQIYDATRWTFLFGRHWIIDWLPFGRTEKITIIEIGCGTGYNLKYLSQNYPKAKLVGYDLSKEMLNVADEKLRYVSNKLILRNEAYHTEGSLPKADVILFSYCLTMVNPHWQDLILQAKNDLKEGGIIAVVDFHNSPFSLFKRWMNKNHVRMDSHLLPFLQSHFQTKKYEIRRAYMGLWHYFLFMGEK